MYSDPLQGYDLHEKVWDGLFLRFPLEVVGVSPGELRGGDLHQAQLMEEVVDLVAEQAFAARVQNNLSCVVGDKKAYATPVGYYAFLREVFVRAHHGVGVDGYR